MWQPLPTANVQVPEVRHDLEVADQPVSPPIAREPAAAETSAGEWPGPQVVDVIEGLTVPASSELWLLDPTDARLVYGRWLLGEDGLERLRSLHRSGVTLARRTTVGTENVQPRPTRWLAGFLQVAATLGFTVSVLSLLIWLHPSEELLGWPQVPLTGMALAVVAAAVARWLGRRSAGRIGEPPIEQAQALVDEIGRRRVTAPSAAAVSLAMRLREAWARLAPHLEGTPASQRARWERRFDDLLYALALSQSSGTRAGRPELRAWVEENTDRLIAALGENASAPPPIWPAPDGTFTHYLGYPTDRH